MPRFGKTIKQRLAELGIQVVRGDIDEAFHDVLDLLLEVKHKPCPHGWRMEDCTFCNGTPYESPLPWEVK